MSRYVRKSSRLTWGASSRCSLRDRNPTLKKRLGGLPAEAASTNFNALIAACRVTRVVLSCRVVVSSCRQNCKDTLKLTPNCLNSQSGFQGEVDLR